MIKFLLKNKWFLLFPVLSILLTACGTKTSSQVLPDYEISDDMIQAQNDFSFELFHHLQETEKENMLISPLSIYMNLSMVYNGAKGETKSGIQIALHQKGFSPERLNQNQAALLKNLTALDSSVTLDIANAVWYRNSLTLKKNFSEINKNYYQTTLRSSDFNSPATVDEINDWVKEKTNAKIETIIEEIQPDDLMFLLNAVYFKGKWTHPFFKEYTHQREFNTPSGKKEIPFMFNNEKYAYAEDQNFQVVELPYGKEHFNMYVFLPSPESNPDDLGEKLDAKSFSGLISKMKKTDLNLYLPKWEAFYTAENLQNQLSSMGMSLAFQNQADFSSLFENQSAAISQVKHKTYIKVDEEGTEAAAVTSTGIVVTSMPVHQPKELMINRPFLYIITEKDSGTILFIGKITDPSKS